MLGASVCVFFLIYIKRNKKLLTLPDKYGIIEVS